MFTTLVRKELRAVILSPKFAATFAVLSVLLLLSVYIGIQEYREGVKQYETATNLSDQRILEQTSWHNLYDKGYRSVDPMQVFVSGLGYDVGRWSEVSADNSVKLRNSAYSDDPVFAVFRFVDFAFIVQVVFALFAILFTYDAVNGEREQGTLRMVFANAVPRTQYLVAKCVGTWLGLVVPVCIPILLSLLLVMMFKIPLTGADWSKVVLLVGISILYISLFIVMGVFISSLTRRSSSSFLLSLVVWVVLVLIIPRASVMAAGQVVHVPQRAEIEGQRDGYAQDRWTQFYADMEKRLLDNARIDEDQATIGDDEFDEEAMWARMKEEDAARKLVQTEIEEYEARLLEDWRHRKETQQKLGLSLSRFSPASAYQLAAMTLAGTDISMKPRYESALNQYRNEFNSYVEEKQSESGQVGGVMIQIGCEEGVKVGTSRENDGLDLSGRPTFTPPAQPLSEVVQPVVTDVGLLAFGIMFSFVGAFVSFRRNDLR
ncbi:MAG: ABC transporter permease subunit [candidate division Zixibacteria bacterium]|nr:ABC transporter permease subunit [candidate division Zixibacteria bacterium]